MRPRRRGQHRIVVVAAAGLIALGPALPEASAATGDVTEFPIPAANALLQGIAAGPDGNLWVAERSGNRIARMTPDGGVREFPVPTSSSQPFGIAAGPDGAMWFTEQNRSKIGRITTGGSITEFPVPTASSQPTGIAAGPDGALWFTERAANKIGRVSTGGTFREFTVPTRSSVPWGIAAGPHGAMWFTEQNGNKIGRITTGGSFSEFPLSIPGRLVSGIALGPDGAMWFTERLGNAVGRIATDGTITEFPVPTVNSNPVGIATGADGNLWFAELGGNRIGQLAPDGTFAEFPVPTANSQPFGITSGPDDAMWFTESAGSKVGRIDPQTDTTPPTIEIRSPLDGAAFTLGQQVVADYSCADEPDGSGLASCEGPVPSGDPVDTSTLGSHAFTVTASDQAGNVASSTHTYTVFEGLYGPLDAMPAMNEANAGQALPIGFEMGADFGRDVLVGSSQQIDCETHAAVRPPEDPGRGHLNSSASGRYTYVWKTDKAWAGTCRSLVLSFDAPGWTSDVVFFARFD